jgi:uncharacterized membrane protein YhaH (DUF805 family)
MMHGMNNDIDNPYAAPASAAPGLPDHTPYAPAWFSLGGRIGRLRYLVYSLVPAVVLLMLLACLIVPFGMERSLRPTLTFGCAGIALAVWVVMTWRRLADSALSGWWALLVLVPPLNLALGGYLLYRRGDPGTNRYGAPPSANTMPVGAGVWVLLLALVTTLAAQFELG